MSATATWRLCEDGKYRNKSRQVRCPHGRERGKCKECGGSQICEHGRFKFQCRECGGVAFCTHSKRRSQCFLCHPSSVVKNYRTNARKRAYLFALSDEKAIYVMSLPCSYCGETPAQGIDRRKNEYGYTNTNSIPCCGTCNRMKSVQTAKAFIEKAHTISRHVVDRETFMARCKKIEEEIRGFEKWQHETSN